MFFKTIESTQLHRHRKQKKTILSSKAGKADNSCHLQIVRKSAFLRDPWPPIFNADKWEHAPLWPLLQLLAWSTGWPFTSATLNAFKWKTWAQRSGWCSECSGLKRRGGGVVPCRTQSQPRARESHAEAPTVSCRAEMGPTSGKHHPELPSNTTKITQV